MASRTGVRETPKRRASSISSSAAPGAKCAAHDVVGELQPQFLRKRHLVTGLRLGRCGTSASRLLMAASAEDREAHVLSSSELVDQAHMRGDDAPAFGEADPGLHLPADLARQLSRWNSVEATAKSRP